ncbi:hypothetical protein ANN_03403 [Periplaneta americana]|uniref:DDE-1 domain-containing protein n=1 Tax=Periplaneta americana TaxID=6978 RepID=A0ABQ8U2F8_PERAM|nr:hypothetical protein ANN_03403 [Periplaneta americana]
MVPILMTRHGGLIYLKPLLRDLPAEVEEDLVQHLLHLERMFYGLTRKAVMKLAYEIAMWNGLKTHFCHEKETARKEWFTYFMKHHPEISLWTPEATSLPRASGFNRVVVGKFFDTLEKLVADNNITASRIFNMDETSHIVVQRPEKIVAQRGKHQVGSIKSCELGQNVTGVYTLNATGYYDPPMLIYGRKHMKDSLALRALAGTIFCCQEKGWMNADLFCEWMQHFISMTRKLAFEFASAREKNFPESCHELVTFHCIQQNHQHRIFNNLGNVLAKHNLEAHQIWNISETSLTNVHKPPKIMTSKGTKQTGSVTSAERGFLITMCCVINATGNTIPPFHIFPRIHFKNFMLTGAPSGSNGSSHISGWMTGDNFLKFLDHFIKHTKCSTSQKVLLIMDNHDSHISVGSLQKATQNGFVMLTLLPHCSHRMQPLNVSMFYHFKNAYNTALVVVVVVVLMVIVLLLLLVVMLLLLLMLVVLLLMVLVVLCLRDVADAGGATPDSASGVALAGSADPGDATLNGASGVAPAGGDGTDKLDDKKNEHDGDHTRPVHQL